MYEWIAVNEVGLGCWVNDYPRNCGENLPHETGESCLSREIAWAIGGIPVSLDFLTIVYHNIRIFGHVRSTLFRSRRHGQVANLNSQANCIRHVSIQCFLYVLAFWCTMTPALIICNLEASNFPPSRESSILLLLLLMSITLPSTGFFNLLIYLRPHYIRCRNEYMAESRCWALRRAALGKLVHPVSSTTATGAFLCNPRTGAASKPNNLKCKQGGGIQEDSGSDEASVAPANASPPGTNEDTERSDDVGEVGPNTQIERDRIES